MNNNNNMVVSNPINHDPSTIQSLSTDSPNDAENDVKLHSKDQRDALPGEPMCIVCGRYGEYICDETDDDVCSLECKQSVLCRISKSSSRVGGLPPPKKLPAADECFYVRDTDNKSGTASLGGDQIQAELLRKKLDIHVKGVVSAPVLSFTSCNLPDKLIHNIEAAGYEMPTPVQMQAIPAASMGKNMLVLADTGSGKSASFLIPIISRCVSHRLTYVSDKKKPLAMVLTPTRELSIQVEEQAKLLGKGLPFKTALVVGGDAIARQLYRIQQGVELIVGTPGRLVDLLTKHEIDLDDIMTFVVDEVDCMLQRGFRDQVLQIFTALSQPQVLMFSATMSDDLEKMANSLAKDTVVITVGEPNRPNKAVKQLAIWVESKQKKQKLFDILTSPKHFKPPVVIYVSSRLGADLLANAITVSTGIKAISIHGEKSMTERRDIMKSFMVGEFPVVVATGVLGRGVDLLGVKQVIVFDMPNSIKEYVHQIGRASRMGEEGQAIVFVNDENKNVFAELVDVLKSGAAAIPRELINSQYTTRVFSGGKGSKKRKYR
ncbi:DEAD-box ATP-dependent RNA helicase [Trifolium repens]|nr:DEAD-box ATP-dependent RNA helicase [Trifolium repens]